MFSLSKQFYSLKDFKIKFKSKKEVCENTIAFYFDIKDSGYSFNAGQYAHFTIIDPRFSDVKGNSRPFSFANSPGEKNEIVIAGRINSSVFINNLTLLNPGSEIYISKPEGNMNLENDVSAPVVFISGGIGITPARSLIENEIKNDSGRDITLLYSNKTESQTAFLEDFKKWSSENKNFIFIPLIEDLTNTNWKYEFGCIDKIILNQYLTDHKKNFYYLIGPAPMIDSISKTLFQMGVSKNNIKTETFS